MFLWLWYSKARSDLFFWLCPIWPFCSSSLSTVESSSEPTAASGTLYKQRCCCCSCIMKYRYANDNSALLTSGLGLCTLHLHKKASDFVALKPDSYEFTFLHVRCIWNKMNTHTQETIFYYYYFIYFHSKFTSFTTELITGPAYKKYIYIYIFLQYSNIEWKVSEPPSLPWGLPLCRDALLLFRVSRWEEYIKPAKHFVLEKGHFLEGWVA